MSFARYRLGHPGRRLRSALVVLGVVFLLLTVRLIQLQGFDSRSFAKMAERQRLHVVSQQGTRGQIVDRDGNAFAFDVEARDIYAQPPHVVDPDATAAKLATALDMPVADVRSKLGSHGPFVYLAQGVDPSVGDAVTALDLPGVGVLPERKRVYPDGDLAASLIGFAGRDGHGLVGLEMAYDRQLAGKDGRLVVEEDPQGRPIPAGIHRESEPEPGDTLQLTINRDIQYFAQKTLADQVQAAQADKGVAIVMDPHTGEVLAMASAPSYDLNKPGSADTRLFHNPAVEWTYEPGSVNKVITVAEAIQRGSVTATTEVDLPGSPSPGIPIPGYTIHDAESHPAERATVAGVLAKSSNEGALLISRMMGGPAVMEAALRGFGFGSTTGVGLPGESPGLLSPSSTWSEATAANIPFGQSMSVTPLQVASAYSTIANGGVRVAPKLLRGFVDADGKLHPTPQAASQQVVSPQTAATVAQMMEEVTTDEGTAPLAVVPGYRVAGKTGTADRVATDPTTGRSHYDGYVASFVGFAPADKPSLVVAVIIDNPKNGHFGGQVAAPAFRAIMGFALSTLRVPPTGTTPVRFPLSVG